MATTAIARTSLPLSTMTTAQFATALAAGTLIKGQWIFISDMTGTSGGGWVMATSASTVALEGEGLFLNPDWQNTGGVSGYSGVGAVTGVAFGGTNYGQWSVSQEGFSLTYSNLVGTFAVGNTVTATSGWVGVILTDDGVGSMTVYSTTGNKPLATDALDNGSGVTCDVDTVGNKTLLGNIYIWGILTDGYSHYQCVDETVADGTDPATSAAYQLLSRANANVGYHTVSDKIEYDATNNWLQARFDKEGNFWRLTKTINDLFVWGYAASPVNDFPWGRPNFTGNKLDNCKFTTANLQASYFFNNEAKSGAIVNFTTVSPIGYISSVKLGINCQVSFASDGANIHDVTLSDFVQYTGKTFTASVSGMWVTESDTVIESLTYGNWTDDGWRYKIQIVTSAELLNNLATSGLTGGIELQPYEANVYYDWRLDWELHFVTTAYTNASQMGVYSQDSVSSSHTLLVSLPITATNFAGDRVIENIQTQMNISHVMPIHNPGERLLLKLANNQNQLTGDSYGIVKMRFRKKIFGV